MQKVIKICVGDWNISKQIRSAFQWVAIFAVIVLLTACSTDSPEARLSDYLTRMGRVLETPIISDESTVSSLPFPRPRELRLKEEEASIGLIDYLSLKGCKLQKVIARANDSLGRVAQPSTRLILHLNFLRLAPGCIERLESKDEIGLAQTLQLAYNTKLERLPQVLWLAIIGGEEYRSFWQKPNTLAEYPTQAFTGADRALVSLAEKSGRWLNGDYQVDAAALESDLQDLSSGDGGSLIKSLTLQQHSLSSLNAAIRKRLSEKPLCHHALAERGQILDNVVRKFFIADVQAWSAKLEARRFKLTPKVRALESLLSDAEPKAFNVWRTQRDEKILLYAQAPKRHAKTLLPLLQQCGRAPNQAS